MHKQLVGVLFASALTPLSVFAQQPQQPAQQPTGVLVVSYQKCNFAKMDELHAWWRQNAAPILDDLVRQGRLLSWGVNQHNWGDEWNNVVYYGARDLTTFHSAFNEFFRRFSQREPNLMQRFAEFCIEHRDNIYSIVMTNSVQPPATARE